MPGVTAKDNFSNGLSTSPGLAEPGFVVDPTVNFQWFHGRVRKRNGMVPEYALASKPGTAPYIGFGTASAGPSVAANTGVVGAAANTYLPHIGCASNTVRRIRCVGGMNTAVPTKAASVPSSIAVQVSTGQGTWATVEAAFLNVPLVASDGSFLIAPWVLQDPVGRHGAPADVVMMDAIINIPAGVTWAQATYAGQIRYWVRVTGIAPADAQSNLVCDVGASYVADTENRIIHLNTWQDRDGTRHVFAIQLYGTDGKSLVYWLDGSALTQSDGLQPDTGGANGPIYFNRNTRCWSVYHDVTGRLVGYVSGLGWFYLIPGNGQVYHLDASSGVDTEFQSLPEGFRAAIPDGDVWSMHDTRIFVAKGQKLYWSTPLFPDLWPNQNEALLGDDDGPITGMASVGGVLVVFKRDSTWVLQSSGDGESYSVDKLMGGIGCVSADSVAVNGGFVYRLAESGPAVFDGNKDAYTNSAIQGMFQGTPFSCAPDRSVGVYLSTVGQYRLFYRSTRSDHLDKALYGDVGEPANVKWWRQGRYAPQDYGFAASAIHSDITRKSNSMLIGDVNGVIWLADAGFYDGPTPVKAKLYSAPISSRDTDVHVVRRVSVVTPLIGKYNYDILVVPDMNETYESSVTVSSVKLSSASHIAFDASTTFNNSAQFKDISDIEIREGPFAMRCRYFQVGIRSASAGPMEMISASVDVNSAGRRSE